MMILRKKTKVLNIFAESIGITYVFIIFYHFFKSYSLCILLDFFPFFYVYLNLLYTRNFLLHLFLFLQFRCSTYA